MMTLFRLLAALLSLPLNAACFGPAHRLLPSKVRLASFAFVSMAILFFIAAVVRHVVVAGADFEQMLTGHVMYFAFLLFIAGEAKAAELVLYMAASIGVDFSIASLGVFGMDISSADVHVPALAWEYLSAAVAIGRLWVSRRASNEAI